MSFQVIHNIFENDDGADFAISGGRLLASLSGNSALFGKPFVKVMDIVSSVMNMKALILTSSVVGQRACNHDIVMDCGCDHLMISLLCQLGVHP
jgi:hypothetical protein